MDDENMWAADRVVASTPGFAITIPETVKQKPGLTNSTKEPSKRGMKSESLLLADSSPQLYSIDSSEKSETFPNMKMKL
ncbi:hypothetical protein Tco_1288516 [Tanacetum coccineum]